MTADQPEQAPPRDLYIPTPEELRGIAAERSDDEERERRRREDPRGWWRR